MIEEMSTDFIEVLALRNSFGMLPMLSEPLMAVLTFR